MNGNKEKERSEKQKKKGLYQVYIFTDSDLVDEINQNVYPPQHVLHCDPYFPPSKICVCPDAIPLKGYVSKEQLKRMCIWYNMELENKDHNRTTFCHITEHNTFYEFLDDILLKLCREIIERYENLIRLLQAMYYFCWIIF